jgi:hypothetical protein
MALQHNLQKCLHGVTLTQVEAIVAKSRSEFYFQQRLLQLVSHAMFHAIFFATRLAVKGQLCMSV